jgi:hypothetical protein
MTSKRMMAMTPSSFRSFIRLRLLFDREEEVKGDWMMLSSREQK